MARSKKAIRVRVAQSGATVGLIMPRERMDELLALLPEGELRDLLIVGTETAEERARMLLREKRLETRLSHESLELFGWELIGDESPIAFAAMRRGDFRLAIVDGTSGWEFGPSGAFDRDPEGTRVLRDAVQVGVFSEKQAAFRLLEPTCDVAGAIAAIDPLVREWHDAVKGMPKPACDVFDARRAKGMLALPEGAREQIQCIGYPHPALHDARDGDEVVHGSMRMYHVSMFPCEAVMRPQRTYDEGCGRALVTGLAWSVGRRDPDPRYAHRSEAILLDGPYHTVMGSSWAVWTNAPNARTGDKGDTVYVAGPSEEIGLATREAAITEALGLAQRFGVREPARLAA